MIKRFAVIFILFGTLLNTPAVSNMTIQLTPRESTHQFPYFKAPTPVWSYNNQVPGPIIRGQKGTVLTVEVFNRLKEGTSVHWHGLRIENSMDGVPGVTQDPIPPDGRFTYRLKLDEAGTFWYHPHLNSSEQLERGLKGVLIVDVSKPLPWSQDLVWLLDDWLLNEDGSIFPYFNTHRDLMHDGRWGNVYTINGMVKPEYQVSPGQRIRLRMINGANARIFMPKIEGLSANVIAVDGRPVSKIFQLNKFFLSPGNRIDLDITIPSDATGKTFEVKNHYTRNPFIIATIKVRNEKPAKTPIFKAPVSPGFIPADVFKDVEVTKTWDLNAMRGGKFGIGWTMNSRLWPEADKADAGLGQPQKMVFTNTSNRLHPMHIHGVFFRVLEFNGESMVEPFTRDTVLVGSKQSVTIGFIPEHKGIWLAHCHIQTHSEAGMMTTIQVE